MMEILYMWRQVLELCKYLIIYIYILYIYILYIYIYIYIYISGTCNNNAFFPTFPANFQTYSAYIVSVFALVFEGMGSMGPHSFVKVGSF